MSDIENTNVETTVEDIKPIVLRFADTHQEYTLEFNRQSVAFAEKRGFPLTPFNTEEIMNKKPAEVIGDLFYYSFLMHHRGINRAITDKILYDDLGGLTSDMIERLIALHTLGYQTLINVEDKPKNSNLTVDM